MRGLCAQIVQCQRVMGQIQSNWVIGRIAIIRTQMAHPTVSHDCLLFEEVGRKKEKNSVSFGKHPYIVSCARVMIPTRLCVSQMLQLSGHKPNHQLLRIV